MSKALTKTDSKNQSLVRPSFQVPSLREVNLPAKPEDSSSNVIVAYKDLNQPAKDIERQHQKNLIIGFVVFFVLGLGLVLGQHFTRNRGVASVEMSNLIPKGAQTTSNTHYHYDKSCYLGENGEQVCMTRESQKR
ncbi:MAG: hypothetical protein ABL930_05155 [Pseudobdellovibrio sp.]